MASLLLSIVILSISYIGYIDCQLVNCTAHTCHCPSSLISREKCILNCDREDSCKYSTLHCRAGDPCEIRCIAKSACKQDTNIFGATATHLTLICNGEDTCKSSTVLHCGTGDCTLLCQGKASCQEFGDINTSLSTSFECNGNCPDIASNIPQSTQSTNIIKETPMFVVHLDNIHPLYYVIALLLLLIFVICFALFCWIYLSHHQAQKLLAIQQARLDSKSVEFRNNIVSPTATSQSSYAHTHAAPRMYRIQSAETTKQRKEVDESSDSETTVTESQIKDEIMNNPPTVCLSICNKCGVYSSQYESEESHIHTTDIDDSMIAVRHSTMSSDPYDIESITEKDDTMDNILILQKRVIIEIPEIPEEISKSFKSYSIEHTPAPKEYSKDCFNEDSSIDANELDRNSYAIQMLGVDEPTQSQTISTLIDDTYLKYLQ